MNPFIALRAHTGGLLLASFASVCCVGPALAADIVNVAPAALLKHVQTHDKVVVYFTSPDPRCGYCNGNANEGIAKVAALVDNDVSFVRVEWTPWVQWPPEVRSLGVTAIPDTRVFKGGVQVYEVAGRVTDPTLFASGLRTAFKRAVDLASIGSVAPAALPKYLQTHDKVVVYFTSPDTACSFCAAPADQLIVRVAPLLDKDVSFVRVEWTPWYEIPPEVKTLRVNGLPVTKAYRGGVQVYEMAGRATDPARLAAGVRAAFSKAVAPAVSPSTAGSTGLLTPPLHAAGKPVSIASTGPIRPLDAGDFGWDLSYRSVLEAYRIDKDEFVRFWLVDKPTRPVHRKFATYAGEPITATLLIEQPDGHAGDPVATWIVRTQTRAGVCNFHPKRMDAPCEALAHDRADAFMREMMAMPMPAQVGGGGPSTGVKMPDGSPMRLNYLGFMSVWVDGRSMQRPIRIEELMGPDSARATSTGGSLGPLNLALQRLFAPAPEPDTPAR